MAGLKRDVRSDCEIVMMKTPEAARFLAFSFLER
jgi:hypothetical protein